MENKLFTSLIESGIYFYKEHGKSADIANMLMTMEVNETGIIHDFIIELSLTMHPNEEVGVGCHSIETIEKAFHEYKITGTTDLLN
ncbi:MAG: hypothetical protein V4606_03480 [Patescibacteria group bacterium]